MKSEFALAFKQVISDKGLPEEIILAALEEAMASAYRRSVRASSAQRVNAKVDIETGEVIIYVEKEVVEEVQDERTEVSLEEAKKANEATELGALEMIESTPDDFGRVAAQTARQVIQQRIREAEREVQYGHYSQKIGEIITGVVQAVQPNEITIGLGINAEGKMPRNQQIDKEYYRVHDRLRALLLDVKETNGDPKIILSRAHRDFLRRLLENEVPEIYQGFVEIRSIAREAGYRSKVAVAALKPGVDPVGACVGIRGVRIQAIVRELHDEKIDVIEWNPNAEEYVAKALSPARVLNVFLDHKAEGMPTATVVVPEDQLSLAIGRRGQNARLAAKLTGWRIDIKSLFEAASDTLYNLQNDPHYAHLASQEIDNIPLIEAIMKKRVEGRPIQPEEFRELQNLIKRVEKNFVERQEAVREKREARIKAAVGAVPADAYDLPLMTLGLPARAQNLLEGSGYENVGDLALQILLDVGSIKNIAGIGDSYIEAIEEALEVMINYKPLPADLEVEGTLTKADVGKKLWKKEKPEEDEAKVVEEDASDEEESETEAEAGAAEAGALDEEDSETEDETGTLDEEENEAEAGTLDENDSDTEDEIDTPEEQK